MSRRFLFRLFAAAVPAGDHVSDRELLRRFVATRDSAAFELLVRRHADAVWVAGLRVLENEADAEDVFQATFLALVRKAGSVRDECIGGWLHRVAVNAALKAKASRERFSASRPEEELRSLTLPARQETNSHESAELASIIHQELARLPERYRLPVVLCDLEGQTHAEAAKSLGWPVGSVSGRLSRAHAILRDRLSRRGLAAQAVLVAASVAPSVATSAAIALAAGSVAASPAVSSLAEGVLSAMRIAKLKLTAAVVAASGLVVLAGVGTGYALTRPGSPVALSPAPEAPADAAAADEPKPEEWTPPPVTRNQDGEQIPPKVPTAFPSLSPPDRTKPDPKFNEKFTKLCPRILGDTPPSVVAADDTYRRLLKGRLHQGRIYLLKVNEIIDIGTWNPGYLSELFLCLDDMRSAAVELWGNNSKELIPWLEEFVIMGKHYEFFVRIRVEAGNEPPQNVHAAQRRRLAAEAALWKAKNAQRPGGAK